MLGLHLGNIWKVSYVDFSLCCGLSSNEGSENCQGTTKIIQNMSPTEGKHRAQRRGCKVESACRQSTTAPLHLNYKHPNHLLSVTQKHGVIVLYPRRSRPSEHLLQDEVRSCRLFVYITGAAHFVTRLFSAVSGLDTPAGRLMVYKPLRSSEPSKSGFNRGRFSAL